MKQQLLVAFLLIPILAGCEKQEKTELDTFAEKQVQSVEWYKANPIERDTVLEFCKNNIGQLKNNANCVNASGAVASAFESNKRIETPKAITFDKKD